MIKKLCLNYFGGPASGKTTAACNIYSRLKKVGINTEMAPEIAKEFVLEENKMALSYQLMVWANQCYRIYTAYQQTDVTITDAPIPLGAIYNESITPAFINVVFEQFNKFNNLNIIVRRKEYPHSMIGRIHSLTESVSIDNQIIRLLESHSIPFIYDDEITDEELIEYILTQTKSDNEL